MSLLKIINNLIRKPTGFVKIKLLMIIHKHKYNQIIKIKEEAINSKITLRFCFHNLEIIIMPILHK